VVSCRPPGSQDLRTVGSAGLLLLADYADRWPLASLTWLKHPSAAGYVSLTDSMGGTSKQMIYRAYRIVK
jgi:hypothetical protein